MDRVRLSSAFTPVYKYVLPTILVVFFCIFVIKPAVDGQLEEARLPFTILLVNALVLVPPAVRFKRIEMDDKSIYVRGLRQEAAVRFDNIARVDEFWFLWPTIVRIKFRQRTSFGTAVYFRARGVAAPFFGPSEATEDLRARAGLL